jgi:hypothetical protein
MDPQRLAVSFWRDRKDDLWCFMCPLCQVQRRVRFQPGFGGLRQVLQIVITSLTFSLVTWPWLEWKGIVSLLPFWITFEIFYRWRARAVLHCAQCGFDPYLFRINVKWAKREIEAHWRKKFAERGIPYPENSP